MASAKAHRAHSQAQRALPLGSRMLKGHEEDSEKQPHRQPVGGRGKFSWGKEGASDTKPVGNQSSLVLQPVGQLVLFY